MILFYLFYQLSLSTDTIAIDFGSYNCKIGNISLMKNPQIITNRQTKRITPTFLAFRPNNNFNPNLSSSLDEEEVMSLEHEIGVNAIDILQKREWAGSGFFPAFIDANQKYAEKLSKKLFIPNPYKNRFGFFNLTSSFINFYIENVYGYIPNNNSHLQIVVPSYYTLPQNKFVVAACEAAGFKKVSIFPEYFAIASYYAYMKSHLFEKVFQQYLFVDVGATSVKAYLLRFSMTNKSETQVRRISYVHKENIGGAFATAKLAEYLKTQIDKEKLSLINDMYIFNIAEKAKCQLTLTNVVQVNIEFEEGNIQTINVTRKIFEELIVDTIIGTVNVALEAAGQYQVDKIEIIGGSSRIPKLQQALLKAFNVERLGKSLNADEVLTLGILYFKVISDEGKFIIINDVTAKPILSARFGDDVKVVCNTSNCIQSLYLKEQPENFSLVYSDTYFNKNLKTKKWTYTWKCSNKSHSNIVFFSPINPDISSIGEVIPNNTKASNKDLTLDFNCTFKLVKPKEWNTKFVDILSNQYLYQKTSAEMINSLEELYYSIFKNGSIRSIYNDSFCEEDINKLKRLLDEINISVIYRSAKLPDEKINVLHKELKEFKHQVIEVKKMKKYLKDLNLTLQKLIKYTEPPLKARHLDLDTFLIDLSNQIYNLKVEFNTEKKKPKEIRKFNIQEAQNKYDLAKSKLEEAITIEKEHFESNPTLVALVMLRSSLISFINRHIWYFKLFDRI